MLGGIEGGRELLSEGPYGKFEQDVNRVIGDRVRSSKASADELWAALANVDWIHDEVSEGIGYSFRAAGDLVAALRNDKEGLAYMHYYCVKEYGVVEGWIAEAMAEAGWRFSLI